MLSRLNLLCTICNIPGIAHADSPTPYVAVFFETYCAISITLCKDDPCSARAPAILITNNIPTKPRLPAIPCSFSGMLQSSPTIISSTCYHVDNKLDHV